MTCRAASSGEVGEDKREIERRYCLLTTDAKLALPFFDNPKVERDQAKTRRRERNSDH
jgi:hypothetical protein